MFSIISHCFKEPLKNYLDSEKKDLQMPTVHPGAVGLDALTSLASITLFVLSVTGVISTGLTGSYILLGVAAFQASIPILSVVGTIHQLPRGYFRSFFMTEDPSATEY